MDSVVFRQVLSVKSAQTFFRRSRKFFFSLVINFASKKSDFIRYAVLFWSNNEGDVPIAQIPLTTKTQCTFSENGQFMTVINEGGNGGIMDGTVTVATMEGELHEAICRVQSKMKEQADMQKTVDKISVKENIERGFAKVKSGKLLLQQKDYKFAYAEFAGAIGYFLAAMQRMVDKQSKQYILIATETQSLMTEAEEIKKIASNVFDITKTGHEKSAYRYSFTPFQHLWRSQSNNRTIGDDGSLFKLEEDDFKLRFQSSNGRVHVVQEILLTEQDYVEDLQTLYNDFFVPLSKASYINFWGSETKVITPDDKIVINDATKLSNILNLHEEMLPRIEARLRNWTRLQCIADIFVEYAPRFKVYADYGMNFKGLRDKIADLRKQNSAFCKWLADRKDAGDIESLMIKPIQRIPRYILLLKELIKQTQRSKDGENHPDFQNIEFAITKVKESAEYLNTKIKHHELQQKLLQLQKNLRPSHYPSLLLPHRIFVMEGDLIFGMVLKRNKLQTPDLRSKGKNVNEETLIFQKTAFLLSDMLILAERDSENNYKQFQHDMKVVNVCIESIFDVPTLMIKRVIDAMFSRSLFGTTECTISFGICDISTIDCNADISSLLELAEPMHSKHKNKASSKQKLKQNTDDGLCEGKVTLSPFRKIRADDNKFVYISVTGCISTRLLPANARFRFQILDSALLLEYNEKRNDIICHVEVVTRKVFRLIIQSARAYSFVSLESVDAAWIAHKAPKNATKASKSSVYPFQIETQSMTTHENGTKEHLSSQKIFCFCECEEKRSKWLQNFYKTVYDMHINDKMLQ